MTIKDILSADNNYKGIYSVCSADPLVLEASFRQALKDKSPLLVEATCNQVNQYGGYTGMKPSDFRNYVYSLAEKTGYNTNTLILGGDHLGTQPFKHLNSNEAIEKACTMAAEFVKAGFTKIHLDASAPCFDDSGLSEEAFKISACERAADMALRINNMNLNNDISYVIGTEVPTPGGVVDNEILIPTSVVDAEETIKLSIDSLKKRDLDHIVDNIAALVVQPGVEFSDTSVHPYNRQSAADLSNFIKNREDLVFEAHSTDYQTTSALKSLVEDGFAILKVGPALTYAKRRALFSLARIESELYSSNSSSNLLSVIDKVMVSIPKYWNSHYRGSDSDLHLARKYSYSDRMRYYWPIKEISYAVDTLIKNLSIVEIPQTLIYEFLPEIFWRERNSNTKLDPKEIVLIYIQNVINQYSMACW